MAQTGNFSPIQLYSSSTPGNAPAVGNLVNSTLGSELAINIADGKLFYKDSANAIQVIGWKTTPTTAGGTGLTSYTAGDMVYWASGTTFTKLGIGTSGYLLTSSGTAPQWTQTLGVANGGTGTSTAFTAGSVVFAGASGVYTQDNAKLFWDNTNKRLGVGTATPATIAEFYSNTAGVNIFGTGDGFNCNIVARSYGGNPSFQIRKYNGTLASPTAVASGNTLSQFISQGYGGTNLRTLSTITSYVDTYVSDTNISSYTVFGNTPAGSSSPSENMRIWGSGGVSIGNTTDPGASNLYVTGKISQGITPYAWGSNYIPHDLGYGAIANNNSANTFHITSNSYNDNTNWKYKFTNGSLRYSLQNDQHEWYYAASGSAGANITYTQVMVLASSGQLYVTGAVQTDGLVSHAGTGGAFGGNKFNFQWTGNPILWVDGTNIGQIATVSDYRLKENVVEQSNTALERIMQLKPVKFNRKNIGIFNASANIEEGFIADQLQAIIPSAVYGEKDAVTESGSIQPQSLNWSPVVSVLTKALQELNDKFEAYVASHP
jgi:hypothetical protein